MHAEKYDGCGLFLSLAFQHLGEIEHPFFFIKGLRYVNYNAASPWKRQGRTCGRIFLVPRTDFIGDSGLLVERDKDGVEDISAC
jgi:hypothetical protein